MLIPRRCWPRVFAGQAYLRLRFSELVCRVRLCVCSNLTFNPKRMRPARSRCICCVSLVVTGRAYKMDCSQPIVLDQAPLALVECVSVYLCRLGPIVFSPARRSSSSRFARSFNMDDDDQGQRILITTWVLTGLSGLFLIVRLICKLKTKRRLWWDDHVLVLSWLMLLTSIILVTISVSKGLGRHVYAVDPENFSTLGLVGNLTGTFSILAATWSKTSFALTLLRLMQGKMKVLLWAIIATVNMFMGLNALFMWIRCSPPLKTWNPYVPGTCWGPHVYTNYGMFAAGYSAAMDFVLALLPWKIIWKLQMKRKEKVGVAMAMSMGIFAGATAIVKTIEIPTLASADFTYVSAGLVYWGAAESAVTIIAASIPVLRTLFRDMKTLSRRYYVSGSNNQTQGSRPGTLRRTPNRVVISGGPPPPVLLKTTLTNSSTDDKTPLRDPCGQI
ncbi:hypothetical protein B0H66DRAFT_555653 [Apodospora peruviana]|uniref:Rhodopsin domain-containing protein n=1 Tax=Apodospora peruviana TaxID=516989 RepID=A0AAE0IDH6_9PEZI|nr:hypothetical protein B0H66DRAFT_555653 [Apodospora peruviana]